MLKFAVKVRRYHRRPHLLYQTTLGRHLVSIGIVVALAIVMTVLLIHFANPRNSFDIHRISVGDILAATANTFYRMFFAYIVSLTVSIPLALLIASTPRVQKILLPIAERLFLFLITVYRREPSFSVRSRAYAALRRTERSFAIFFASGECRASKRSSIVCMLTQRASLVSKTRAKRIAVSGLIPRRPLSISLSLT
jgi:hypothetical protein